MISGYLLPEAVASHILGYGLLVKAEALADFLRPCTLSLQLLDMVNLVHLEHPFPLPFKGIVNIPHDSMGISDDYFVHSRSIFLGKISLRYTHALPSPHAASPARPSNRDNSPQNGLRSEGRGVTPHTRSAR